MSQGATGAAAAFAASLCYSLALVVQRYEAQKSSAAGLRLIIALALRPIWLLGIAFQLAGFGLFTYALTAAPVSIVQPMFAAGIVFVPVFAAVVLREYPGSREIVGMATTVIGMIAIVATMGEGAALGQVSTASLLVVMGTLVLILLALRSVSIRLGNHGRGGAGIIAGITAGIAFGAADSMNKLMGGWLAPGDGWTPPAVLGIAAACLLVVFGLLGFVIYQNALRSFRAITVVSGLSPANMLVPILVAVCVFGESLPSGRINTAARIAGIVLVLAGGWLLSRSERASVVYQDAEPTSPDPVGRERSAISCDRVESRR